MKHRAILAVLLCGTLAGAMRFDGKPITLQAEQATLVDVMPATTRAAFEGDGYVTGFTNSRGEVRFDVESPTTAVYHCSIRYSAPGKGYVMTIGDVGNDGFFAPSQDKWATHDAGKIELEAGMNPITIGKGWGYYDIDSMTLTPSSPYPAPKPIAPTPCNPKASPIVRSLMKQLADGYGHVTLSGLIKKDDVDIVRRAAGKDISPAIVAGDLIDYTPSRVEHGVDPSHEVERLIAAHRAGQIVALAWHWNAPTNLIDKKDFTDENGNKIDASWYRGFYSNSTTFDFAAALDHPDSAEYRLLIRDIDAIAVQLRRLRAAGVPVLWRPLHESDGKWFWWGTRGPDQFKKLWRLLYDRLTVHHGLDNLLWVYTWNDPDWYPGDDVVDVVGIDAYPTKTNDTLASKWASTFTQFDGRKMIALTEFGGVPDIERMHRLGVRWCYFTSWSGELGPAKNSADELKRIFNSPLIKNLPKPSK